MSLNQKLFLFIYLYLFSLISLQVTPVDGFLCAIGSKDVKAKTAKITKG